MFIAHAVYSAQLDTIFNDSCSDMKEKDTDND